MKIFEINTSIISDRYCCKTDEYDIISDIPHSNKFMATLKCGKTAEFESINDEWYSECDEHILKLMIYLLKLDDKRILIFKYQVIKAGKIIRKISGNNILDNDNLLKIKKMGITIFHRNKN